MAIYRIALKSLEQRAAAKPNVIEMGFASDADAITFGFNCDSDVGMCSAQCTSVDLELSTNYALPYPAGTELSGRIAFGDGPGNRNNVNLKNVVAGGITNAMIDGIIAAGYLMVKPDGSVGDAPIYGNQTNFRLTPSF